MNRPATITLGTETEEGFIPHKRMTFGSLSFDAPVRVITKKEGGGSAVQKNRHDMYYPKAERRDGRLVYALSGGYVAMGDQ